jgi:hypothetical protein
VTDVDFNKELGVPEGEKRESLVFFFDPPWGGVDY